jgi:aminodeoxyfutalosine synthase|tara:strand:- start:72151 stop:73257 length:1107 start_codon:yes stop_codon:yes gene_type:complete
LEEILDNFDQLCFDHSLITIKNKILNNERLGFKEAEIIMETRDLNSLGVLAKYKKFLKDGRKIYFVVNRHINPTNICAISCKFCAFGKTKKSSDAYEMSMDQILSLLNEELKEIHIVGGLHPDWKFDKYLEIIREVSRAMPGAHIKAFTAVEIDWFAQISGYSIEKVISELMEAGVDALPGGGAEIFAPEVRKKICSPKTTGDSWLSIHKAAHKLGLPSNATILYGHLESNHDVIDHLEKLRNLQDETNGFLAFIPVLFQPYNTQLKHVKPFPFSYDLKIHALSRLYLDNFPHIKAYWITLGEKAAQVAFHYGVSDADGTIISEKIIHDAGAKSEVGHTREFFVKMIKDSGYLPVERDALYNELKTYD